MNIEQAEGQLAEFEGKSVTVVIPIRGTVFQSVFGMLKIEHDWEHHIISYELINYTFDTVISFQAHDVQKIATPLKPSTSNFVAKIFLKPDTFMQQSKLDHA